MKKIKQTHTVTGGLNSDSLQTLFSTDTPAMTLAPWWKRLMNLLIDSAFIFTFYKILKWVYIYINLFSTLAKTGGDSDYERDMFRAAAADNLSSLPKWDILFVLVGYYLLAEVSVGSTIAKFFTSTIVLDLESNAKPRRRKRLKRTFCRLLPIEFLSFLTLRPFGWHDRFSGTYVTTNKYYQFFKVGIYGKSNISQAIYYYFSTFLSKRYRRLVAAGAFIFPSICGVLLYKLTGYTIESERVGKVNYEWSSLWLGFIVGFVAYWIGYFVIAWIIRDSQEETKTL